MSPESHPDSRSEGATDDHPSMTIRTIPASPAERAYQHALRDQQDAAARVAAVRGALVTLAGGPIRPCRMEINALADNLAAAEAAADLAVW